MFALIGTRANDYLRLPNFGKIVLSVLALAFASLLASCGTSDVNVLTDACVRAGNASSVAAGAARLQAVCSCASQSAKDHLAPDDFRLLVQFARTYGESAPAQIREGQLITALAEWHVSGPKAAAALVDIMSLEGHVAQECTVSSGGEK